ncbi:MAG: acyl-CoA dehydrogenase [Deltaproteobacteria bacterium]|nr:acyl-CoA dehydrogenase [Deltaproteobacteria bacterium]
MNFGFSEEQEMLRSEVRRFLDEHCPIPEVRRLKETGLGFSEKLWTEMARLGWLGITLPEAYGGAGLTWVDWVVLLEETGRSLFPSPLIANTLAATAILEVGSEEQKRRWLPGLADGSRKGTVALFEEGDGLRATDTALRGERDGEGFVLSGQKRYVADPEAADLFIVSFRCGEEPDDVGLAVLEADTAGVEAEAFPLIDETKRMGNLGLNGVPVSTDQILGTPGKVGPQIERLISQGAIAITAEISGAVDAALQLTVQYANDRLQFGHPIGHYQAVKHPLAEIYVDLESFRSLLYYGAWAIDSRPDEVPRSASLAKAYAVDTFVRMGIDGIQLHGATGFTVAYDIHLYFKRSKWARPMFGDANAHYERAFELRHLPLLKGGAHFDLTPEEEQFRQEVRTFLAEHNPPRQTRGPREMVRWWKAVREKRYVGFAWPGECGGGDGTVMEQFILKEEMLKAEAPMIGKDYTGLGWVGPAIIQFGSDEQKERYLPDILDGKSAWCTGYSEPDIGSDLAGLQCKAVRDGDEYIVDGQKTWISLAHMGTGIYSMVRTDFECEKFDGITCLLIPLDSPGIEVRPIKSFAGDHFADLYNEVFFNGVRVPVENRVGKEGEGWQIICSALQNERSGIAEVNRHHKALERLVALAGRSRIAGKPAREDAELRRNLSRFSARIEAARLNGLRTLTRQVRGDLTQSDASINKLHNCNLLVAMAEMGMELLGGASPYVGDTEASLDRGRWQIGALGWPTTVIGGGTPNIQRNIIAERMLGLPKD